MQNPYSKAESLARDAKDACFELTEAARACLAVADLMDYAGRRPTAFSMDNLGELLTVHHQAIAAHVQTVDGLLTRVRDAMPTGPDGKAVRAMALEALDLLTPVQIANGALEAMGDMLPAADDGLCKGLAASMRIVSDALEASANALDTQVEALQSEIARTQKQGFVFHQSS